jgi:hypothetical protein
MFQLYINLQLVFKKYFFLVTIPYYPHIYKGIIGHKGSGLI